MNAGRILIVVASALMSSFTGFAAAEEASMRIRLTINGKPVTATLADNATARDFLTLKDRQIKITVGQRTFSATLHDNETAAAFRAWLPLMLDMRDVNRNEKAYNLPSRLPSADASPRTIQSGDLMLWSSRTVVVFYKSFSTPYSYTKLGRIDDPAGLAEALGTGDVTVKFELQ